MLCLNSFFLCRSHASFLGALPVLQGQINQRPWERLALWEPRRCRRKSWQRKPLLLYTRVRGACVNLSPGAGGGSHFCLAFWFNPLTSRRTQVSPFTEISILFEKGSSKKKKSFECRAYESVDEKSLS